MSSLNSTKPTSPNTTAPYNAYDGAETLRVMMAQIYDQLRTHSAFGSQKTYEKIKFDFQLTFHPFGHDPKASSGSGELSTRPPLTLTVNNSAPVAPDEGRRAAGLPLPGPKMTSGGMVDVIPKI